MLMDLNQVFKYLFPYYSGFGGVATRSQEHIFINVI